MRHRLDLRPLAAAVVLLAVAGGAGCSDEEGGTPAAGSAAPAPESSPTTGPTFCGELEGFYAANGAFFRTVTSGEATAADLDQLASSVAFLPGTAPAELAGDAEVVVASIDHLVASLRQVDLADPAAVTPLLLDSTDDEASAAAERLDAYARETCGIDPEDAATP